MKKHIQVKPMKCFVKEYDDPRLIHNASQEHENAISRLELIKTKRKVMDTKMNKLNVEMEEFKKYVHDQSLKVEDYLDTIDECENIIRDGETKQEMYTENIKSIGIKKSKLDRIVQDLESCIESYKPYEEFIEKVIAKNPRYKDVNDIIKHVEEMACIRNISSVLKISDFNEKEQINNNSSAEINIYKRPKNNNISLNVNFNDARTYPDELKKADLMFIQTNANIKSSGYAHEVHLNPVNPKYLKADTDTMKDKLKFERMEEFKKQIQERENENNYVISIILQQYRELYLRNNKKLPTKFPTADVQLKYIWDFYKTLVKKIEIYNNLKSGKKTFEDYISEYKD